MSKTIYSPGWGKRLITFNRTTRPFAINEEGWFNLSKWVYMPPPMDDDMELDSYLKPLFNERMEIRENAEQELAYRLMRAAIGGMDLIKDETYGPAYNGPRIKRNFTPRISLRDLTIIVVEHRARVIEWKRKQIAHKASKVKAPRPVLEPEPEPEPEVVLLAEEPPDNWEDLC